MLEASSVSTPLGFLQVSLPFAVNGSITFGSRAAGSVLYSGINAVGQPNSLKVFISEGNSYFKVVESTTTDLTDDVADKIQALSRLYFNFSYFTA